MQFFNKQIFFIASIFSSITITASPFNDEINTVIHELIKVNHTTKVLANVSKNTLFIEASGEPYNLSALSKYKGELSLTLRFTNTKTSISKETECLITPSVKNLNISSDTPLNLSFITSFINLEELVIFSDEIHNIEAISQCKKLKKLKIEIKSLESLNFLKDINLSQISIKRCINLTDISGLAGMSLIDVELVYLPKLHDISALKGSPLKKLIIMLTPIDNISNLNCSFLNYLNLFGTSVSNIEVLKDAPLYRLNLCNTKVIDLSPLIGKKIVSLDVKLPPPKHLKEFENTIAQIEIGELGLGIENFDRLSNHNWDSFAKVKNSISFIKQ